MADKHFSGGLTQSQTKIFDDLVFARRSIRKYSDESLPEQWIEAMLRCAHQVPSPSNSQPVRFVKIETDTPIRNLKQSLERGHERLLALHQGMDGPARLRNWINAYRRYAEVMFAAPVLLAVGATTETRGFSSQLIAAGLFHDASRSQTDVDMTVGLALNALLLKAQSLGVGSCILTAPLFFISDVEQLLGLEKMTVKCFVTLGMPAEKPNAPERQPLRSVVQVI